MVIQRIDWSQRANRPGKVVGVRRNFRSAFPAGHQPKALPDLWVKPPSTVVGEGAAIYVPEGIEQLVAEVELAIIIDTDARDVAPGDVHKIIRGVVCGNDVTAVDLIRSDGDMIRAKTLNGFCPLSADVMPYDLVKAGVRLRSFVNGSPKQDGNTKDMVFSVEAAISHISRWYGLEAGDVVMMGTPGPVPMISPGDTVRAEVEGVGAVTNRFVQSRGG